MTEALIIHTLVLALQLRCRILRRLEQDWKRERERKRKGRKTVSSPPLSLDHGHFLDRCSIRVLTVPYNSRSDGED